MKKDRKKWRIYRHETASQNNVARQKALQIQWEINAQLDKNKL